MNKSFFGDKILLGSFEGLYVDQTAFNLTKDPPASLYFLFFEGRGFDSLFYSLFFIYILYIHAAFSEKPTISVGSIEAPWGKVKKRKKKEERRSKINRGGEQEKERKKKPLFA